jgi:anti-sigma-K factor RskA
LVTEHQQQQASLYALGTLSGTEREAFEAELRQDAGLRELVRELQQTTVLLGRSAPPAKLPADLKAKVLRRVENEARSAEVPPGKHKPLTRREPPEA